MNGHMQGSRPSLPYRALVAGLVLGGFGLSAHATLIGGVEFPQGTISFADAVVNYDPLTKNGEPTVPNSQPDRALGTPDYVGGPGCLSTSDCRFVSLGDGGSITLQFVDNRLTGSGNSQLDLWVFEVGPDVEDTFVEISKDGSTWYSVGKVFGATSGIDIDAYGFGPSDLFSHVRLTDDGAEGAQSGNSVGADIDALGAITTVPSIPEPGTYAMMIAGLGVLGLVGRRFRR